MSSCVKTADDVIIWTETDVEHSQYDLTSYLKTGGPTGLQTRDLTPAKCTEFGTLNWPASSVWVFIAQLVEHCSASAEATGSNPVEAPKNFFLRATSQLVKLRFKSDGHILISFVFPQFTSFHSTS